MARHRHLVKAAADREAAPALPDAPDFGDQSDDVYQPEEQPEDVLADPPDMRDISAELSAPPKRKLPWPTLLLTSSVVAVLAFTGGVLVEKGQSSGSAAPGGAAAAGGARFGGAASAGTGGQAPGGGNAGGAGSGMTAGTVKVVDGSTIYVTDAQGNIIKVKTGKSTQVSVAKSGKVSDLKPGQTVTVRGSQSSSGDITATTVTEGGTVGGFGARGGAQPSSSSGG
ncbi:hypothetical protein ACFXJ5_19185 [Streptomyces sp. NPDC059373]